MAKQSGLGDQLFVAGYDISGDVGAVQRIAAPSDVMDLTSILKSAHERGYLAFDGAIEFASFFNDAANQEHDVLKAKASGADRVISYFHGSAIGNMAAALVAKQSNYDWKRGANGAIEAALKCNANAFGLDYCEQLTAGKRTDGSATNGSSFDAGAATALGLVAYLQVFAFTGTSVTVKIQQSSDNGVGDAWEDLITFTAASGITAERKVTASLTTAVGRYLRVVTTGTFSNAVIAVCASRYPVAL